MPSYTYECSNKHEYETFLPIAEYKKKTKCPECGKAGKKTIKLQQTEASFTEKLYGSGGFWDKALNKVFTSASERKSWMKKHGYQESGKGSSNKDTDRLLYSWRVGQFDPREARHARKD